MSAQSQMNALTGLVTGAAVAGTKIFKSGKGALPSEKALNESVSSVSAEEVAKDLKMAAKARREAQNKITAIISNKEISQKARTRRIGKVLDEFKGGEKDGK